MSDKKTAEEIAKTIPCQCSDCGMRESEATQMIQAYADQELASLREQLEKEQEISQRLSDDLASALDTIEQKEDENRELVEHLSMILTMDKFEEYFSREFLDKTESLISRLSAKL